MKIFRIVSFIAVLTQTSTASIAENAPVRFERDGATYVYTSSHAGDRTIIAGHTYPTGARYRLSVRDGRVTGQVDGRAVDFRIPVAKPAATVIASTN